MHILVLSTRHFAIRAKSVSVRVCPCPSVCSRPTLAAPPGHPAIRASAYPFSVAHPRGGAALHRGVSRSSHLHSFTAKPEPSHV